MKLTAVLVALVAGLAGAAGSSSATTSASCSGAVSWQRAGRMVGRVATIKAPVASTTYASSSNGSPTFLNIGAAYPSSRRFTVVIWIENRARFGRRTVG